MPLLQKARLVLSKLTRCLDPRHDTNVATERLHLMLQMLQAGTSAWIPQYGFTLFIEVITKIAGWDLFGLNYLWLYHAHLLSYISNSGGIRSTFGIRLLIPIPLSGEQGRHLEFTTNLTCQSSRPETTFLQTLLNSCSHDMLLEKTQFLWKKTNFPREGPTFPQFLLGANFPSFCNNWADFTGELPWERKWSHLLGRFHWQRANLPWQRPRVNFLLAKGIKEGFHHWADFTGKRVNFPSFPRNGVNFCLGGGHGKGQILLGTCGLNSL